MEFESFDIVKISCINEQLHGKVGVVVGHDLTLHDYRIKINKPDGQDIYVTVNEKNLYLVIDNDSIIKTAEKIIGKAPVTKRIITPMVDLLKDCYEIMGLEFDEEFFNEKITSDLSERTEMEQVLINEDRMLAHKAKAYDLICEKMFMASGVIEDGDSTKWIIDPDTVCSEILKIIVNDINVDRNDIIKMKKDIVSRIVKDGDSW